MSPVSTTESALLYRGRASGHRPRARGRPDTDVAIRGAAHRLPPGYGAFQAGRTPGTSLAQLLWAEAQARGWESVYDTQVLGDGARWIWRLAEAHFHDSRQTVDWYHDTEHLYTAAHLYRPDDPDAAQRWYKAVETSLFQGHASRISQLLKHKTHGDSPWAKALRTEAQSFETNKRRMQYLELREEGYLLGSGPVESGVKQFKARFTGPGMRWSRAGIERLIPILAAIMSGQFDALWPTIYNSPQKS